MITATESLTTAPRDNGCIGNIVMYLGLGRIIVPRPTIRLDREGLHLELPVALEAEEKK